MNEFDLQFKIFTVVDTTKSYVIVNESMNKLLSVSESIVLMGYALYETSFNDPTVNFHLSTLDFYHNCNLLIFSTYYSKNKLK